MSATMTAPAMITAEYSGHRPCPARPGYLELVLRLAGERLNWCVAAGDEEESVPPAERLELRQLRRGVALVGVAGDVEWPISGHQAVELLGRGTVELLVDRRLAALHQ